jgi:diguanylate cyclase (GGDEF)-like protein/PAS domain S-box-containing protein
MVVQPDRRIEPFSRLPVAARLFLGATIAVAAGLLLSHAEWPRDSRLTMFAALLVTGCLASRVTLRLPTNRHRANLSASFIVDFLSLLLLGPHPTILVAGIGGACHSLTGPRRNPFYRTLFNVACSVVTIEVTGLAYTLTGGTIGYLNFPSSVTALAVAILVYFLVNSGLVAMAVSTSTGQSAARVWHQAFLWSGPSYFIGGGVTVAFVGLVQEGQWALLPLVAIPIHLTYRAYAVYSDRLEYEHRHREIIESLNEGMAVIDHEGQVTLWNDALERMLGSSRADAVGRPLLSVVQGPEAQQLSALIVRATSTVAPQSVDALRLRRGDTDGVYQVRAFPYAGGTTLFWTDVTQRVQAEEALRHAALHDALTGLPNRTLFVELVNQALARAAGQRPGGCAVLFVDVDRFKVINDSLGHQAGDELLKTTVSRLRACLRHGDTLARMGGDEFTVLLHDIRGAGDAIAVAEAIQRELRMPVELGSREVAVSASIGIALNQADHVTADHIMRDADIAMYRAKDSGRARHELFDTALHAQVKDKLGFENDLRRAVDRNELTLTYQPIVLLASGQAVGFEALVRWQRNGEVVPPAEFIPVAEDLGLIEPLGSWVLREVCAQFAEWRRRRPAGSISHVTVNVSTHQLVLPNFVTIVRRAVRDAGLEPHMLHLEITETALLRQADLVVSVLKELRSFGVKVYLDDFGTGFSSLSHLHRLPVDALKLDRTFVSTLMDAGRPSIVESVMALANTLGTPVIAEGVETEAQLLELTRLGCTSAQGYLFAGPLTAASAEAFMAGIQVRAGRPLRPVRTTGTPRHDVDVAAVPAASPVVH